MKKIFELEQHVADLIAAGEVVERPASVVKELVENSIDAGAGVITVEIQAGGMTYIRVTDDGCGIAPEDVKTAFLRHATSKLRGADGLEAIGTLGFRGEALAAIASVSRIELLTREQGAKEGVSLSLEAGSVTDQSPAGCPEGTNIIVRDLFFNTPARLKFMKSDRAESSAVASTVLRCALSRPDVSFRFIRDGKTEYHTPGDSRVDSCIYSLLGREFSAGLIQAESSDEALLVTGFVSSPAAARGNRSYQFFFVNGRPIQSRTLNAALEQAFVNNLPSGRYPSCVLYVTINFGMVDVNVHPSKTEVKFISDKQVFDGVYYAALGAIDNAQRTMHNAQLGDSGATGIRSSAQGALNNSQFGAANGAKSDGSVFKSMSVDEYRNSYGSVAPGAQGSGGRGQGSDGALLPRNTEFRMRNAQLEHEGDEAETSNAQLSPLNSQFSTPSFEFRVIGEALNTYIIVERSGSVWFIDKHAAHERIHFDALRHSDFEPMPQVLITPVICKHGQEDASLLFENTQLLERLGFSVESFGDDAVAVRQIPAEIDISDVEPVLSDICAQLKLGGTPAPAQCDEIYRAVACKAAIKAGKSSNMRELETLTARVLSGEAAQCPHGRPVAYEMSKAMFERTFKRS